VTLGTSLLVIMALGNFDNKNFEIRPLLFVVVVLDEDAGLLVLAEGVC
jgi:hypothetical protein